MKRSEILKIIQDCWVDSTSFPTDSAVANYILKAIEKAGMQPPQHYDSYYDDEPECDGMISEWEPEDEA